MFVTAPKENITSSTSQPSCYLMQQPHVHAHAVNCRGGDAAATPGHACMSRLLHCFTAAFSLLHKVHHVCATADSHLAVLLRALATLWREDPACPLL